MPFFTSSHQFESTNGTVVAICGAGYRLKLQSYTTSSWNYTKKNIMYKTEISSDKNNNSQIISNPSPKHIFPTCTLYNFSLCIISLHKCILHKPYVIRCCTTATTNNIHQAILRKILKLYITIPVKTTSIIKYHWHGELRHQQPFANNNIRCKQKSTWMVVNKIQVS